MTRAHFRTTDPMTIPRRSGAGGPRGTVGLPGTDSIGMGYDVFGGFVASPRSTTAQLFELGSHEDFEISEGSYVKPKTVHVQTLQEGGIVRTEGKTSSEYQADRAAKAGLTGSYGFFSGSLDAEFTSNERRCVSYNFVSQTDRFHKYLLSLPADDALAALVRADVRTDLDGLPPERLFKRYGTHFLRSLIIGATSVYSSATNTSEYSSRISAKVALELQYKVLTNSLSGKLSDEEKQAVSQINSSSHLEIFVQGGSAEFASEILEGRYEPWVQSIGKNMAFVGLNTNSLQPIWALCAGRRREELASAYADSAKAHPAEAAPDIVVIHHFFTNVQKSRHYYSQNAHDFPDGDWQRSDAFKFYAFKDPGVDRIPIYRHKSSKDDPKRFMLSPAQKGGSGWADSVDLAFHAYKTIAEGRVPVFGYTAEDDSAHHGWLYTTNESVKGWKRGQPAFYVPAVK